MVGCQNRVSRRRPPVLNLLAIRGAYNPIHAQEEVKQGTTYDCFSDLWSQLLSPQRIPSSRQLRTSQRTCKHKPLQPFWSTAGKTRHDSPPPQTMSKKMMAGTTIRRQLQMIQEVLQLRSKKRLLLELLVSAHLSKMG